MAKYATLVPMLSIEDVETNSQTDNGSGSEGSNVDEGIMLLSAPGDVVYQSDYLVIKSAEDLIRLSYVAEEYYQFKTLIFSPPAGTTTFDVTGSKFIKECNTNLSFYGLGSEKYPFAGSIEFQNSGVTNLRFKLNRPLFRYLADTSCSSSSENSSYNPGTINVNLYSGVTDGDTPPAALLAEKAVRHTFESSRSATCNVKLYTVKLSESTDLVSPPPVGDNAWSIPYH